MISKMTKYDFVLYSGQSEDFIERLRELGLVDITTTGWEAQEDDRQLITDIETRLKAKDALEAFRAGESFIESAGTTTCKEISMGKSAGHYFILKRLCNMRLTYHIVKSGWSASTV